MWVMMVPQAFGSPNTSIVKYMWHHKVKYGQLELRHELGLLILAHLMECNTVHL